MEVGIPCLDADHIKLLEILNNLHDEFFNPTGKHKIKKLFIQFYNVKLYHFRKEEILFKEFKYPHGPVHTSQHKQFSDNIKNIRNSMLSDNYDDMANILVNWFVDHILEEDMQYKPFFLERYEKVMKFCALYKLHNLNATPSTKTVERQLFCPVGDNYNGRS